MKGVYLSARDSAFDSAHGPGYSGRRAQFNLQKFFYGIGFWIAKSYWVAKRRLFGLTAHHIEYIAYGGGTKPTLSNLYMATPKDSLPRLRLLIFPFREFINHVWYSIHLHSLGTACSVISCRSQGTPDYHLRCEGFCYWKNAPWVL